MSEVVEEDDEWITFKAAARLLHVHHSNIAKMLRRGDLTSRKGRRPSLRRSEVLELAETRAEAARLRALPPPPKEPTPEPQPPDSVHTWVQADVIAASLGVQPAAVHQRARRGRLPRTISPDGTIWFRPDLVEMTVRAQAATRSKTLTSSS
jgi:hypothetical protein